MQVQCLKEYLMGLEAQGLTPPRTVMLFLSVDRATSIERQQFRYRQAVKNNEAVRRSARGLLQCAPSCCVCAAQLLFPPSITAHRHAAAALEHSRTLFAIVSACLAACQHVWQRVSMFSSVFGSLAACNLSANMHWPCGTVDSGASKMWVNVCAGK
jgi:hypothetical protein